MTATDHRPHSRACGMHAHPHGTQCHRNCPTCGGRPVTAASYPAPTSDAEAVGERLATPDDVWGPAGAGHVARYQLAAGYCRPGDIVLDAACGIGYAAPILAPSGSHVRYLGIDRRPPDGGWPQTVRNGQPWTNSSVTYMTADLTTLDWCRDLAPEGFDVAVSFETLEHLDNPGPLLTALTAARRYIVASVPVVPTTEHNPWHLSDWEPGQLAQVLAMVDPDWVHLQTWPQPAELAEVVVMGRRSTLPHLADW